MTAPYMTQRALNETQYYQRRPDPLEDPLNYGALADFSELFELIAALKTWARKKKRTERISPDAFRSVNHSQPKAIFQI